MSMRVSIVETKVRQVKQVISVLLNSLAIPWNQSLKGGDKWISFLNFSRFGNISKKEA